MARARERVVQVLIGLRLDQVEWLEKQQGLSRSELVREGVDLLMLKYTRGEVDHETDQRRR